MSTNVKVSRIQKRGQVTIPVSIRQKLHLEEGDLVAFIETKEGVVISPQVLSPQEVIPAVTGNKKSTGEELSIVEQTAGIFRQRQDGSQGEIDFERAREAFMDYFASRAKDEVTDSQA
jgi:AbrB family looped-hinge helix DNA binding protein